MQVEIAYLMKNYGFWLCQNERFFDDTFLNLILDFF